MSQTRRFSIDDARTGLNSKKPQLIIEDIEDTAANQQPGPSLPQAYSSHSSETSEVPFPVVDDIYDDRIVTDREHQLSSLNADNNLLRLILTMRKQ
jgi:hypothetical protein